MEQYNALIYLARLQRLSGNPDAAIRTCDGALAVFPGDGRLLLEQGRLLVSVGEYERAGSALSFLLANSRDGELLAQGRCLAALLDAFKSANPLLLAALANEAEYLQYRSAIYFTLWKTTGLSSWLARLNAEFPQSPEAKMAQGATAGNASRVETAPTPLWLLYPGRSSISLSAPLPPAPAPSAPAALNTVPPSSTPRAVIPASSIIPSIPDGSRPPAISASPGRALQTGYFSREENARALAENIKKAGFEPQIVRRQVNGNDRWTVYVPCGADENATIKKLKDAGFESFPVKLN